jgi:hypothetical protein
MTDKALSDIQDTGEADTGALLYIVSRGNTRGIHPRSLQVGISDGDKGDITVSGTGTVLTIDADAVTTAKIINDAVSNAKLADMSAWTIKVRNAATTGDPSDVNPASLTEKTLPTSNDSILITDTGAANGLKRVKIGTIGVSGNTTTPYEYGANGHGGGDDTASLTAAIATGKHIDLRGGLFPISTGLTLAASQRMFNGRLIKIGNVDMVTLGSGAVLDYVTLHGNGATWTGRGIVVTGGVSQYIKNCLVTDMSGYALEFTTDGAGSGSIIQSCQMGRNNTALEAIKLPTDSGTNGLRTFIDVKGSGAALFDLGGSHFTQIFGGNSTLITFTTDTNATIIQGHRTGAMDVKGTAHIINGCPLGNTLTVKDGATNICIGPNIMQGGSVVLEANTTGVFFRNDEALTNSSVGGFLVHARSAYAAIATNATDGFLYVPTCAGTPTGTPTTITGMAPIIVNTTNNKLYFYSGGAWRDAGP